MVGCLDILLSSDLGVLLGLRLRVSCIFECAIDGFDDLLERRLEDHATHDDLVEDEVNPAETTERSGHSGKEQPAESAKWRHTSTRDCYRIEYPRLRSCAKSACDRELLFVRASACVLTCRCGR